MGLVQGSASTQRGFEVEDDTITWSNYRLARAGSRVQSILTGRNIYVFSPPEDPPSAQHDATDELLAESADLLAKAREVGQQLTREAALLGLEIPDDARSITERELEPA